MTLTWQKDRELKKVVKSGVSTTYTYNNGGIRTSKTTGGKRTDYYLSGSKIVTMKEGSDIIHFIYDQDGKLVSMRLKGKDYYYLHNSQGDVIGLVDSSGTQVVSYQYDSWGRQISMKANIPSNEEIGTGTRLGTGSTTLMQRPEGLSMQTIPVFYRLARNI